MILPAGPALPAAIQTLLYAMWHIDFLDWCHRRYGDVFTINTLLLGREVVICDPDMVKQVFTGNHDELNAGEANAFLEPAVGKHSVLLLDGAEHLRQRKMLMPPFLGERMVAYGETIRGITEWVMASWPLGQPFSLGPHLRRITQEVILRIVFGVGEGAQLEELREVLARTSSIPIVRLGCFGLSPWDAYQKDSRRLDALIHRQIARRRESGAPGKDALHMLLKVRDEAGRPLSDDELCDEMKTLLVAGNETTANALTWTFELVLGDPQVKELLATELATMTSLTAIGRLEYLDAVIKEVLRMRPAFAAVRRRLKAPLSLGRYDLPAGVIVSPTMWLSQRHPASYAEPEAFRPERFLGAKTDSFTWYPFGGGSRRCLGMAFALYEMKVVIATVLLGAELRKCHPELAPMQPRSLTFYPKGGTEVVLERRKPAARSYQGEAPTGCPATSPALDLGFSGYEPVKPGPRPGRP
jgi:cytochrome P450